MKNNEIQNKEEIKIQGVRLHKTGAEFDASLSFDEWENIGKTLKFFEKSILFWIGDWINYGEMNYHEKYSQALATTGYERQTLENAAWVARSIPISARAENVPFKHHEVVASVPKEHQKRWLERAEKEDLGFRELRSEIQKERLTQKLKLPSNKYRVIYADPPWKYNDKLIEGYGAAEHHYPAMDMQSLCSMPIHGLSEEDSVLFLWVTSPLLEEAFMLIRAWGYQYKTSFVWDKINHNMGHYNSVRHELLLVCTKGQCTPEVKKLYDSVISIERSEKHSEKPEEFRRIIDEIYPSGKRIELFARNKSENWDSFGNEL